MKSDTDPAHTLVEVPESTARRAWHSPVIEDADISVLTNGGGTSGVEGTPFLKTGS